MLRLDRLALQSAYHKDKSLRVKALLVLSEGPEDRNGGGAMAQLVTGLMLFLGVHSVSIVAPEWRDRSVARLGLRPWQGIYAAAALAGLVLIVMGYADARNQTAVVYASPRWMNAISATLMLPVFPLLLAAYLPGIIRTALKHPMLVAVKLWALAHLLVNGSAADVLLFGSILVWAAADRISLKRRPPRRVATAPAGRFNDLIAVVGGIAIYSVMLNGGHAWLVGVPLVLR